VLWFAANDLLRGLMCRIKTKPLIVIALYGGFVLFNPFMLNLI